MKSIRYLYRIGRGPSSSHTICPSNAAMLIKEKYSSQLKEVNIVLYGSLAFTGRGHLTDKVIEETFYPVKTNIKFDLDTEVEFPNTMTIEVKLLDNSTVKHTILSLGGGAFSIDGKHADDDKTDLYSLSTFKDIKNYCKKENITLQEYVYQNEGIEIKDFLLNVLNTMIAAVDSGIQKDGVLPGRLKVQRKARYFFTNVKQNEKESEKLIRLMSAYAFACGEENASGGIVVTAPTCGSCGVLPAVLKYYKENYHVTDEQLIDALAVAGLIGNIIKTNGSISGAEAGCQAEIGSATAMAAVAISTLKKLNVDQIEYAAEVAIEHTLGLTCDPVMGYVQIPCIERNAIGALKAATSSEIAEYLFEFHKVSFDTAVKTAYITGKDLNTKYRETSTGGLANYDFGE